MRTFSINTLGCKANQYESQQIREFLEQMGLTKSSKPHLVVVNTCCVTHTASAKSRHSISKAIRANPNAVIVVCGCLPAIQNTELNGLRDNIYLIKNRGNLAADLSRIVNGTLTASEPESTQISLDNNIKPKNDTKIKHKNDLEASFQRCQPFSCELPQITVFKGSTRAFLKVQDGCDGYCTYCIIPKARPNVHSKHLEMVLNEAKSLICAGHKEIVITGIFLGAYGQKTVRRRCWDEAEPNKLSIMLEKLAQLPGLQRIRLSSLEPGDVNDGLLDIFCKYPNIMPHLHLSLQSGSNKILKRMCRQYTAEQFLQKVELIKSRLDRPAITTDIIVGFPGETEEDHKQTVDLAKKVGFAKMHVFPFSRREGTAAANMKDIVKNEVVKSRCEFLRNLSNKLAFEFQQQFVGQDATILIESVNNSQTTGRAERYFPVSIQNAHYKKNDLVQVELIENTADGMLGCPKKK